MINWLKHQKRSHLTDNLDWLREQDGEKRSYLTDNFEWLRNDDAEKRSFLTDNVEWLRDQDSEKRAVPWTILKTCLWCVNRTDTSTCDDIG